MSETKYILFTIIYIAIAVVFVLKLGPDMVKGSNNIDGSVLIFNRVSELEIKLRKQHDGSRYKLGDKVYDSIPFNIQFDTINKKYKYLFASFKMDTFFLSFNFDLENQSKNFKNFLKVMDQSGLLIKEDYMENLPITFENKQIHVLKEVKIVLEKKGDLKNKNNYIAINNKKVQGYNINLRKKIALIISYTVWILSGISLVIISYGAYIQLKDHSKNGVKPYIPNRWEGIKNFFSLFSKNKE